MYIVTLKKSYTEMEFTFGTWDTASEFVMIVLKSAEKEVEVFVKKGEE